MRKIHVIAILLGACAAARANVTLGGLFADHMVLQRDLPVSCHRHGRSREKVAVSFAGQNRSATAGADGKWSVKLAAHEGLQAAGRP